MHNFSKMAVRAAVSLALFGSVSMANAADTIKIGIAGPLTVAQYGDMQFTGGKMAVEQINKAGGIKGKQIEAVIYDDACDPKQAVAIANKVINDGVKFVVGHLCSDNTLPASDIYEDEGVLMVTGLHQPQDHRARLPADPAYHRSGQRPGPDRRQVHHRAGQTPARGRHPRQETVR
jgi:branched-chain amino acid transport system substrate-binding protein